MKPTLQLGLKQTIHLTPTLQSAIDLLGLSARMLQDEILAQVEANPLLTIADPNFQPKVFDNAQTEPIAIEDERSLRDHLLWQLQLSPLTELEQLIGTAIIHSINEEGFLSCSPEEIYHTLREYDVTPSDIQTVLHQIQQFEPAGCGSQNMTECLLRQLEQLPEATPWKHQALLLVKQYLPLLAKKDYATLKRRLNLTDQTLIALVKHIRALPFRPNIRHHPSNIDAITPDLVVSKHEDQWQVQLNPDTQIPLNIERQYLPFIQSSTTQQERDYFKTKLKEAKWFINSINKRHDTLLKVANYLIDAQHDFFEKGQAALRPLTLAQVADALALHESTLSRITSQKYFTAPGGTFALRALISSKISSDQPTLSQKAILAMLQQLVAEENPKEPLNDSKLSSELNKRGVYLARRTITKYREVLRIPPYYLRKQLV